MHLAGSIADRFIKAQLEKAKTQQQEVCIPNLYQLGAAALLMAAKLEQPISPSFKRMIALLPVCEQAKVSVEDLVNIEEMIIKTLNFDL